MFAADLASDLALALDPDLLFEKVVGGKPDPWQSEIVGGNWKKLLANCCRQSGKTTSSASLALGEFLHSPGSTTVILSPSQRQSGDVLRRITNYYHALSGVVSLRAESATRLESESGSSIISLPASEGTIRGIPNVGLLILDECSRIPRELIVACKPMQAVARHARLIAMSTPNGSAPGNWFYDQWSRGIGWKRLTVTADQCSRITPEFIAETLAEIGPTMLRQEFYGDFAAVAQGQLFAPQLIEAAFDPNLKPLFVPSVQI